MRLTSPLTILVVSIAAGSLAIGYNLFLLMRPLATSGSRFAYLTLGIVIIMGSWYVYELQKEKKQSIQQDLPKISDMENPNTLPAMTPDQLYVLQQLFRNDYQIHVKPLSGGFINSGIFRVIQEQEQGNRLNDFGYVVKYLSVNNVRQEIDIHENGGILSRYLLPFTPGKSINSWPSGTDLTVSSKSTLGAICYHFATLEKGSQLRTLTEIYKQHPFSEIENYLKILFDNRLSPWYKQRLNEQGKPLGGSQGEYGRLFRNWERIQIGMRPLLETSDQQWQTKKQIELTFLPKSWQQQGYNPLYWIHHILELGQAECFRVESRYSPVHGDLHTGNILVEQGRDTHVWLIDFANTHIGPAVIDFATLEANIKFYLLDEAQCSFEEWLTFEQKLLTPLTQFPRFTLTEPWYTDWEPNGELYKAWQFIRFLRERIMKNHLIGGDVRAYYLALLNATLPVLYRDSHSKSQKLRALTSAAWMCEHLT